MSSTREKFLYPVELLTIPRLNVSCYDRRGVDYATLTQALLQVLASYSMQLFFNSHVLTPIPMHLIPIPWLILLPFPWESHGIPVFPIPMHTSTPFLSFPPSPHSILHFRAGKPPPQIQLGCLGSAVSSPNWAKLQRTLRVQAHDRNFVRTRGPSWD